MEFSGKAWKDSEFTLPDRPPPKKSQNRVYAYVQTTCQSFTMHFQQYFSLHDPL